MKHSEVNNVYRINVQRSKSLMPSEITVVNTIFSSYNLSSGRKKELLCSETDRICMTTKKKKKKLCNFLEQYFKEEKCQLMLLYQNFQIMLKSTTALFSAWGVTTCPGDTALHTDTNRLFLPCGLLLSSFSAYCCQDTLPQSACCHPSSAPELQ